MSIPDPSQLFKIASGLFAVAAPAHMLLGFETVYPALKTVPKTGKHAQGARGAENCWNYVAVSMAIASLINWQWSRTGGPATQEEHGIFWLIAGMHAINGFRYAQVGLYPALLPMWVAPGLSILALQRSK